MIKIMLSPTQYLDILRNYAVRWTAVNGYAIYIWSDTYARDVFCQLFPETR